MSHQQYCRTVGGQNQVKPKGFYVLKTVNNKLSKKRFFSKCTCCSLKLNSLFWGDRACFSSERDKRRQGRGLSGPPVQTLWTSCRVGEINHHQRWLSQSCSRSGPLLCSLLIKPESGDRNQLHRWYERKRFMRKQVRHLSAVFDDCEQLNKNTNGFFPLLWRKGRFAAVHQQPHYLQMSDFPVARGHTYSSWDVSGCWNVPISQSNENKMSLGW